MVMFGKAIEQVGAKPMQPRRYQRMIINALPLAFKGSVLWVAALIGEEIFDSLQRQMMDDPELQPMVQRLMRIHVTEEARHIQFARDGAAQARRRRCRGSAGCGWPISTASAGCFFRLPVHQPGAVPPGRPRRHARRGASRAAARTATRCRCSGFAPLAAFLDEVGLMGPIARRMWTPHPLPPGRRRRRRPADGRRRPRRTRTSTTVPPSLRVGDADHAVRVRLTGHLEPIDGQYHWQGTVFGALPDDVLKHPKATLTVDGRTAQARITERTPQGDYSVVGVGTPPFA